MRRGSPDLHFYPRPPRGGRPGWRPRPPWRCNFYPRPPRGGRLSAGVISWLCINFYPRPPRGGRPLRSRRPAKPAEDFYPRPPRGGRRAGPMERRNVARFLSTPSARRATALFSPYCARLCISIHALREEGDWPRSMSPHGWGTFLSTPSARRATPFLLRDVVRRFISIHALREEGDLPRASRAAGRRDFYPRPPRGGRPTVPATIHPLHNYFYPRPPRGGRRDSGLLCFSVIDFYPRPPRGGRRAQVLALSQCAYFYPRPPRGGRPGVDTQDDRMEYISIHALREEGDSKNRDKISIFL